MRRLRVPVDCCTARRVSSCSASRTSPARADQLLEVLASVDADHRAPGLDVEIDVPVEVEDVEQALEVVPRDVALADQRSSELRSARVASSGGLPVSAPASARSGPPPGPATSPSPTRRLRAPRGRSWHASRRPSRACGFVVRSALRVTRVGPGRAARRPSAGPLLLPSCCSGACPGPTTRAALLPPAPFLAAVLRAVGSRWRTRSRSRYRTPTHRPCRGRRCRCARAGGSDLPGGTPTRAAAALLAAGLRAGLRRGGRRRGRGAIGHVVVGHEVVVRVEVGIRRALALRLLTGPRGERVTLLARLLALLLLLAGDLAVDEELLGQRPGFWPGSR